MSLESIAARLRQASHVTVFTGAGASAESGIPTFRDALTGLWERFDPGELATAEAYRADPSLCWGWYEWRRARVLRASPNAAHFAIARLADFVPALTVVTQNVDDLHERAGSTGVIHLHGSLHSPRCMDCGAAFEMLEAVPDLPLEGQRVQPPRCKGCDGFVRPGVVWFGEMLPENNWSAAVAAAEASDMFLSIGTSGIVYPAAELPLRALGRGSTVVHINPVPLELSAAEYMLQGSASMLMPELLAEAFGRTNPH